MPEVKEFFRKENLDFKVLVLLDNAPGRSDTLIGVDPNVEVRFLLPLPPNTISLIQPMDQTIIATFKA